MEMNNSQVYLLPRHARSAKRGIGIAVVSHPSVRQSVRGVPSLQLGTVTLAGWRLSVRVCPLSAQRARGASRAINLLRTRPPVERRRREDRVTIPGFSTCHRCNGSGRVRA